MKVNSYNTELSYELIGALPYAYKLFSEGALTKTESGVDTKCFYFFSPDHTENNKQRGWNSMKDAWANNAANIKIHRPDLDYDKFLPPPLKEKYKNKKFVFEKPILCICNRINIEWGKGLINFFDLNCLEELFKLLSPCYQIVYFNIEGKKEYYDGVEPVSLEGEKKLLKKYSVIHIQDLHRKNQKLSFNELQLMVMANSAAFITMQGGYGLLASYFGGTNIIYSKCCREIAPGTNSFYRWYHKLGGSRIIHTDNYYDLQNLAQEIFVQAKPLVNILVRTHNRPNFFNDCYNSIAKQTYRNINIIAGTHHQSADQYITPYRVLPVKYKEIGVSAIPDPPAVHGYGRKFPANHYENILNNAVKSGWILYLDDDDTLTQNTSLAKIISSIKSEDDLLLWKVQFPQRIIPSDDNFGKAPVCKDISGIGFMFHSKHLPHVFWDTYKQADYRIIAKLYDLLNPVWIDDILTESKGAGAGKAQDKILPIAALGIRNDEQDNPVIMKRAWNAPEKEIANP